MAKQQFNKLIWLVDTIYRSGRITFAEINRRWRTGDSTRTDIPLRTFHNHRQAIEEMFDINIECDKCTNTYYIADAEGMLGDKLKMWLLNSFSLNNILQENVDMKNRIAAKKEKDTGFILIDLNSLKHINDTMGHETGDRYITCISQAYLNMGPEDGIMYRIGGDEFVVVMPGASEERIRGFAGRLEEEFEKLAFMPGLTFAWGAAIYDADTDNDLFSTCRRADKNMYMKKQKFYEDRMKREDGDGIVGQAVKERAKGQ